MIKKTYLLFFFVSLFLLFAGSLLAISFSEHHQHITVSEEYTIIESSDAVSLFSLFSAVGFFLGIAPFIFFINLDNPPDKRIVIWVGITILSYFLFPFFRKSLDDTIQNSVLIALFHFMSGTNLGTAIQLRYKDILEKKH